MPIDMKSVIAEAFKDMVRRGNADKITVKALIEECHISRQTFYYHFQDILDVMEWSIKQETKRLTQESIKADDMRSALKIFISFTADHFSVLEKLMGSQRRPQFEKFMVESMETYLGEMAKYKAPKASGSFGYFDREVLLRYTACGLVGVLLTYGKNTDPDLLASRLELILPGGIPKDGK